MMRACCVGMVAMIAGSAAADTVTATFNTVDPGSNGSFSIDGGANWGSTGPAGLFNWTRTGGTYAGLQGNFYAFCTELTEHVGYGGSYTYDVTSLENVPTSLGGMGSAKADLVRELFGRFYNPAFTGALDVDHAAAMQMSIWEIVYENGPTLDVTTGNAQFVNDDVTAMGLANIMLASLDGTGPKSNEVFALASVGTQDMIVPAPGTLVLAGAGAVAMRRRRR